MAEAKTVAAAKVLAEAGMVEAAEAVQGVADSSSTPVPYSPEAAAATSSSQPTHTSPANGGATGGGRRRLSHRRHA